MANENIDEFIEKELENIKPFKTITIDTDEISLENFNKALVICQKNIDKLMKKNGDLLDILKKINSNKLSKKIANEKIKSIADEIKNNIDKKLNKKLKFIINNRIDQLLKIAIYYTLK